MPNILSDVIYDVGLFDGEDTSYYLSRGYNVVAVDANPLMVEKAKVRFAKEIAVKRLILLNVGISSEMGTETFCIACPHFGCTVFETSRGSWCASLSENRH